MNCNLFCHLYYISLHVMRLFAAHRSNFDTLNVPHSGCKTYISSSVVVEMPVSSAWCLNVIQISFYSEEDKRGVLGNYIASVLFVHKAFWKLHLTISVLLLLSLNMLRVDSMNSTSNGPTGGWGHFFEMSFVFQIIDEDCCQTVAWR